MKQHVNYATGHKGLIAVDKIGNRILFLDTGTYEEVFSIDGFAPNVHELCISPDHRKAFVPIYGDGKHGDNPHPGHLIAKFDLEKRRHIGDFSVAPYVAPHALRWGRDMALFCVCENSGVVLELDAETGTIVHDIKVGSNNAHRIEILPDGSKLYTENEEDSFCSVIDLTERRHVRNIPTPNGTGGIGLSPDGRVLVYTDASKPELLIVDTSTDTVVRVVKLEGLEKPAQIARFSPDGFHMVVTSHDEPKGIIFDASLNSQKLIELGQGPMDMGFHPDGRSVLVANQDGGTVSVVDLDTGRSTRTVSVGDGVEILSFF